MVCKIDTCSVIFVHSKISKERRSEKIILTRSWVLVVVDSDKDNADKCEYKYLHVIFSISIREKNQLGSKNLMILKCALARSTSRLNVQCSVMKIRPFFSFVLYTQCDALQIPI